MNLNTFHTIPGTPQDNITVQSITKEKLNTVESTFTDVKPNDSHKNFIYNSDKKSDAPLGLI